ncbi:MAG: hypothetical protein ABI678_10005 [Kofleriaceae bacterium]
MKSRAAVRRALALLPDAQRHALAQPLAELAGIAGGLPLAERAQLIAGYLFDPRAGALLATTDDRAAWLATPLFEIVGPGNAAFVDDTIAALLVAPLLAKGGALAAIAIDRRFAPRADDAVALAVSALPREAQEATLTRLLVPPQDPDRAVLAAVQCGRIVAWSPHLAATPAGERAIAGLLELFSASRPKPLLDEVARALGPIAAQPGPLAERIRDAAFAAIDALQATPPRSFADEVAAIGKQRSLPDQDRWMALPARELAAAAAYVLGISAPHDREAFGPYRALVLERPEADDLLEPFLAGLVAGAHIPACTELAAGLLAAGGEAAATAIALAAVLPLDALDDVLLGQLDSELADHRALACAAVELLEGDAIDRALALRLGDPAADVAAAAAHTLIERGRRDLIEDHATREVHPVRRAIAAAVLGDLSVPVVGELVRALLATLEADPEGEAPGVSPLIRLTTKCLLASADGLDTLTHLITGVPESAGLFALAVIEEIGAERDIGVLAPPDPRSRLGAAAMRIATNPEAGPELGTLALGLLAHVSAGDTTLADVIADALATPDGYAANLIAALGELRVATPRTGEVLAPLLAPDQPIGARVMTAAICGRALPHGHEAWRHVRELLSLGTIARAAARAALRDRARQL